MVSILLILASVCFAGGSFCVYMLLRNQRVYEFRTRLIHAMRPGEDDYWELSDEFSRVEYDDMMKYFWRPLRSFYAGTKLLGKIR